MYFDSFSAFLAMGGYAFYVWTAYGLTALLIGVNLVAMVLRRRQVRTDIRRALRREQGTPRTPGTGT